MKPQNVILRPDGRAVLADFGLVKLWDPRDPRTRTAMRGMGTPEYAPPEQYDAAMGHTDPRSDIYALGATLYHALTGEAPPTATMQIVEPEVLVPVRGVNPSVSPQTEAAVMRALALRPGERFQSAEEMRAALEGGEEARKRRGERRWKGGEVGRGEEVSRPGTGTVVMEGVGEVAVGVPGVRAPAKRSQAARIAVAVVLGVLLTTWGLRAVMGRHPPRTIPQAEGTEKGNAAWITPSFTPTPIFPSTPHSSVPVPTSMSASMLIPTPIPTPGPTKRPSPTPPTIAPFPASVPTATAVPIVPPTDTPTPPPSPVCPPVDGPFSPVWEDVWSKIGCAAGATINGLIAEETFEGGKMFWREPIDFAQALVVFNDGTWKIFTHAPYREDMPEFSCVDTDTPPQCPPTPKRGFGMMWCDIAEIRSRLGNALDCEHTYTGSMQQFEAGFMVQGEDGSTYVFYTDGFWERR